VNNKRTTDEQQVNTNNKENKDNNVNKDSFYRKFAHLKMTVEEYDKLHLNYTQKQIDDVLDRLENWKNNTKYKSMYRTALQWLKKEPIKQNGTNSITDEELNRKYGADND
jgi:hypothetical protein